MKKNIIIYRVVTGIFTFHMLFTVVAYIFMHDMVSEVFESLGVPSSIIYPLAVAKVLGLIAIWTNKSKILKELAYLGFLLDFILAIYTHYLANDGGAIAPLIALLFLTVSYIYNRKVSAASSEIVQPA